MDEKRCPKCQSGMVIKVAKRGPNAGGKFYSCNRFPDCRGTLPFDSKTAFYSEEKETNFYPVSLVAREKFKDYQVQFFETVAVPEDLLNQVYLGDIGENVLREFSQWRIDYPLGNSQHILSEKQKQIVSVIEKILKRGKITLSSPKIENDLKEIFCAEEDGAYHSWLEIMKNCTFKREKENIWFDSEEEKIAYNEIFPQLLGENFGQLVIPQVGLSSLIPDVIDDFSLGSQRVDFAIFHPDEKGKIIVEIDGSQHNKNKENDEERDKFLKKYDYSVMRIPAKEIREKRGPNLEKLFSMVDFWEYNSEETVNKQKKGLVKYISALKTVHQLQLIILQAIKTGFLNLREINSWVIISDVDKVGIFEEEESQIIMEKAIDDFLELLKNVGKIYSESFPTQISSCKKNAFENQIEGKNSIYISFANSYSNASTKFYVQNIFFPKNITNSSFSAPPLSEPLEKPKEVVLEYFLNYVFRKKNFWEGQYDGINRALRGEDTLLLLPTGAGKSMVYQLSSFLLPGRIIVIAPIIALMEDQIDNLSKLGIDRCIAITSRIFDPNEREKAYKLLGQGEYLFVFIAPERFQTIEFRDSLRALTVHNPVALVVVDEAHCVSEWGHDFRTAYLNIGRTARVYCESNGVTPPIISLTGTASKAVLKDVQRELEINDFDAIITPKSFDRKELKFIVIHSDSSEKISRLKGLLGQKLPDQFNTSNTTFFQANRGNNTFSGLVFCPHVGGDFGIESVADDLRTSLGVETNIYSGKKPKKWSPLGYDYHKKRVAKNFKQNKFPLLISTKAFGMGIDKSNIRYTIHYGLPQSIESFYQEAGRAGRDRRTAFCCIIVSNDDPDRSKKLLDPNTSVEEIDGIVRGTRWEENDDITRCLFFHVNAFRGIEKEKDDIGMILEKIGDVRKRENVTITIPEGIRAKEDDRSNIRAITEKAIHRLLILGVISDYTINYSSEEFLIKLSGVSKEQIIETYGDYVASYLQSRRKIEEQEAMKLIGLPTKEFIMGMVERLLGFIYGVIERGRRRALNEMLMTCLTSKKDEEIRRRILNYLEATEYSKSLEEVIQETDIAFQKCMDLFSSVRSPNEAAELRGETSRFLESYPDHPGLLLLRSLSEVFSRDRDLHVARENFFAAISSGKTKYGIGDFEIIEFASWAIKHVFKAEKELAGELSFEILKAFPNRESVRELILTLPNSLKHIPAFFLLREINDECKKLIDG